MYLAEWLQDVLNLFFPQSCACCGKKLCKSETILCVFCEYNLPQTNAHLFHDSPLAMLFWGRIRVSNVAALYIFQKGGRVQRLIHQFKYQGKKEIGEKAGRLFGQFLAQSETIRTADLIVPVPLHPKKKKKRGYNQSDYFAKGLSESLGIPWSDNVVQRLINSSSQTRRKSRYERWENVRDIFNVGNPELIRQKHVLLVDDVITTGSTMEACASALFSAGSAQISAVGMAHSH